MPWYLFVRSPVMVVVLDAELGRIIELETQILEKNCFLTDFREICTLYAKHLF